MDKKKENNIITIMTLIIIILIIFIILVFTGVINFNKENNLDNQSEIINDNTEHDFNAFLDDITDPLGWLIMRHNFSQYANRTGINYLSNYEDKEIFTFEYILKNQDNFKYFIVLNTTTGEKVEDSPTSDLTLAYYPYSLFNEEFKKFFNEDFDINRRIISNGTDNEYDKSSDYLFYHNSHSGANGLSIEKIELIDSKYDRDTGKFTANVNMTYSDEFSNDIGMNEEKAEIIYTVNSGNIVMESFIVGTSL